MANALYKDHLLVWYVFHDTQTGHWIPEMTIMWTIDGESQFHSFNGPPQSSFDAALDLGKELAEAWVDRKP
jgi:hypothetical protein